jgi:C-terminal processing protease CtpA/Prc
LPGNRLHRSALILLAAAGAAAAGGCAPSHESRAPQPERSQCYADMALARDLLHVAWSFRTYRGAAQNRGYFRDGATARTPEACARALQGFLGGLEDGHSRLHHYPGLDYTAPPIELFSRTERLIRYDREGRPPPVWVVSHDTTDAALADLLPGSRLLSIDGTPVEGVRDEIWRRASGSTQRWKDYVTDRSLLLGPASTTVELRVLGPDGITRTIIAARPPYPGVDTIRQALVDVSVGPKRVASSRRLEAGWGYVRLSTFIAGRSSSVSAAFDAALDSLQDAPGLVLDLRGNGGGYLQAMLDVAGRFLETPDTLGYYQRRPHAERIDFSAWDPAESTLGLRTALTASPGERVYRGPLVILIDRSCFSACEGLAGALQQLGRAEVIGTPSGGGSGVAALIELPGGAIISMSWSVFWLPDGRLIEGRGIVPDVFVANHRKDWIEGYDRVLARAIRELEK